MRGVVASLIVIAGVLGACSTVSEEKPSCFTVGCGAHGKCELVGDSESCVCDLGYAGTSCAECASGFQDVDGNGLCSSSCGDCGPHARCSEVSGRAVCSCFVGYSPHEAGGCTFTGGPVDPGFDAPQPNGWRTSGAVRISTGRPSDAPEGTGWARFGGFGEVSQSFEMPPYADAEPLAVEVDLACATSGYCGNVRLPASIVFDGVTLDNYFITGQRGPVGSMETVRFCLGERAFGRTVELGLRRYPNSTATNRGRGEDALVGRMQILPSADCAAPGTVKNGDFEAGAWNFPNAVEIVQENGTHVARFTAACGGKGASSVTTASIPEAMSRPALLFSINGKSGGSADIYLDSTAVGQVRATGTKERAVVCLPPWTRGFAFWLAVRAEAPSDCAVSPNVVDVDDFVVASDPSCDDDTIGNSGFERPGLSPWTGRHATVVSADAHSGSASLALRPTCTEEARISTSFMVPPRGAGADGGAAVRFWYRLPANVSTDVSVGDGLEAPGHSLDPAATWTEKVICLPPHSWGHRAFLDLMVAHRAPDGGECSGGLDIDDVSLGTDPQCPVD